LKKDIQEIIRKKIYALIKKRNIILDRHDNSFEAFKLPEIKKIDQEIDRLEESLWPLRLKEIFDGMD
jgi:hypothetical protein